MDTTDPSYWLNWRFFLCALWILIAVVGAGIVIFKYEVFKFDKSKIEDKKNHEEQVGVLYEDETWRTSWKAIHPVWLLVYRLIAFCVLLVLLITNLVLEGGDIFYFYTQWTFALVTFYFGFGSSLSIYGCWQYWNEVGDDKTNHVGLDAERGVYMPPSQEENLSPNVRKTAGILGFTFQILFQVCAGASGLTDSVFWFVIYPFLTPANYSLHFLDICLHSVNAILLIVEITFNCLRFPFFRLAYFLLWTITFVIFQWIVHACVSMWWPYSFLDLSSPYAPIWYLGMGLIHLPAFGIFALMVRVKQCCLSRCC